jgi:hypothetical protein
MPVTVPDSVDVTPLVIEDLLARTRKGVATYGKPLQSFNGRVAERDMYEELLDAVQYAKQNLLEAEGRRVAIDHLLEVANRVIADTKLGPEETCPLCKTIGAHAETCQFVKLEAATRRLEGLFGR